MGNRVGKKPLSRKSVRSGGRQIGARAFMNHQRRAEFLYDLVEPIVVRIVQRAALYRIRPDEDSFEFKFENYPPRLGDSRIDVLYRNDADTHQTFTIGAAVIIEPVIISAAERHGVGFFFDGRKIETGRREEHAALDAVAIHVLESSVRIRGQVTMFIDGRIV